jgi:hypothetical protein
MFDHSGQQIVIVTTMVVVKVRKRLAVNKQRSHSLHTDRFNLKKLNDVEGKEQFRVEVSNRIAALEDLDTEVEINSSWETIREKKLHGLNPRVNYIDRATAACRRSDCQLLRIKGATWSA